MAKKPQFCLHCGDRTQTFYRVLLNHQPTSVCKKCAHEINPPIKSNNSTCRSMDHHWMPTTAGNYRRCDRINCGAVQRLVGDTWQDVERVSRKQSPKSWEEAEYDMLNAPHQADYADYRQASTDLKKYWR